MNKKERNPALLALVACILLAFSLANSVFAFPVQQENVYVYDEADVITAEEEADINSRAKALFALTGARIETVCVKNTGDKSTSEYALDLFAEWKLGSSDKNNGILILLSIEGNDYWTIQGSGLKSSLTDSDLQRINNEYLEPDFAAKKYGDGAKKTFDALLGKLEEIYSVDVSKWDGTTTQSTAPASADTASDKTEDSSGFSIWKFFRILLITVLIAAGVIAAVTVFAFIRRPRYVGSGGTKRRHYNTERGTYVSMPPKGNIDRARMRQAPRPQNGTNPARAQGQQGGASQSGGVRQGNIAGQGHIRRPEQYPQRPRPQSANRQDPRTRQGGTQNGQRRHEHPTVYPDRPPYIDRNNAKGSKPGRNGGRK